MKRLSAACRKVCTERYLSSEGCVVRVESEQRSVTILRTDQVLTA